MPLVCQSDHLGMDNEIYFCYMFNMTGLGNDDSLAKALPYLWLKLYRESYSNNCLSRPTVPSHFLKMS